VKEEKIPEAEKKNVKEFKEMPSIDLEKLNKEFREISTNYYKEIQKITTLELTYAHRTHLRQLDLAIEKQKRAKLIS